MPRKFRRFASSRLFAFDDFSKQFANFTFGRRQRIPSQRRCPIHLAHRFAIALGGGAEVSLLLQPMEYGVKRPRTDPVTVFGKLLHHAEPENRFLRGVMQYVEAN